MNPILPLDCFVPDGEVHFMPDGRAYLYGSWDLKDVQEYCSNRYHVFSSADLVHWVDHGESLSIENELLWAPDCIGKDGKYYLYACTSGGGEVTAVCDSPAGPFTDMKPLNFADGKGIDPCVFVDDDGQGYYFWGQIALKGARLNPDMRSIDESSVTWNILTEEAHGFHEGSSIRKINGTYYMVYTDISRGRATCLSYATSDKPLGPYTKRGVIIDNTFCDPNSWNNHGSIEMINGQLYVFYHRSSRNGVFSRRMCAERLTMLPDGSIPEVRMSVNGVEPPLDAFKRLEASRASRICCDGGYITTDEVLPERLTKLRGNTFRYGICEYRTLDFGSGASGFEVCVKGKGIIKVCQDDRTEAAVMEIDSPDDFTVCSVKYPFKGGAHSAVLLIDSSEGLDIRTIRFTK